MGAWCDFDAEDVISVVMCYVFGEGRVREEITTTTTNATTTTTTTTTASRNNSYAEGVDMMLACAESTGRKIGSDLNFRC